MISSEFSSFALSVEAVFTFAKRDQLWSDQINKMDPMPHNSQISYVLAGSLNYRIDRNLTLAMVTWC